MSEASAGNALLSHLHRICKTEEELGIGGLGDLAVGCSGEVLSPDVVVAIPAGVDELVVNLNSSASISLYMGHHCRFPPENIHSPRNILKVYHYLLLNLAENSVFLDCGKTSA